MRLTRLASLFIYNKCALAVVHDCTMPLTVWELLLIFSFPHSLNALVCGNERAEPVMFMYIQYSDQLLVSESPPELACVALPSFIRELMVSSLSVKSVTALRLLQSNSQVSSSRISTLS